MATILAPYNTAMQLGAGFNTFTQQQCIDNAVIQDRVSPDNDETKASKSPVAQEVTYKSSIVDKVTDVSNAMNINPAFNIKYDNFTAKGKLDFINTSKVKESDVSFMISVKVVNQIIYDHSLTRFNPISELTELNSGNFADVYGDSFISGFQEGGEFTAVISIKASDRRKVDSIKADAAITFTNEKLKAGVHVNMDKLDTSFLEENETTISVTWTGGGQNLKKPEEEWTFDTMRSAALKFPYLVAETPMRTHAILTKYTALRSFYSATLGISKPLIPPFEKAGVYTAMLQEAYLDYKTIAKNLQILAFDVSSNTQKLLPAPAAAAKKQDAGAEVPETGKKETGGSESDAESIISLGPTKGENTPEGPAALRISEPYPADVNGLESARQTVRMMLNRIVAEVDLVTRTPQVAVDEHRQLPYMSPLLFKEFLPVGSGVLGPTGPIVDTTKTKDAEPMDVVNMAKTMGGTMRF